MAVLRAIYLCKTKSASAIGFLLFAVLLRVLPAYAQGTPATSSIFTEEELLEFKLQVDYKALTRDRGDERGYHQATIFHENKSTGQATTIGLKVRVRGKHRRNPSICNFPPLLLNFPRTKILHTVFAGENKLKLVTHCLNDDYVIREYLVYKLYNVVSPISFRVRLCKVTYEDTQGKKDPESHFAFLIEDEEAMAKRSNGILIADEIVIRMDATQDLAMAKLALFQYMIGNTDWSVPYRHNIKVLYFEDRGEAVPVPYDFDYTGIVQPPYAKPPPEVGITSVRQRVFRGYSFPASVHQQIIQFFQTKKDDFYQVYLANKLLEDKYQKRTIEFLDKFYEVLESDKKYRKYIVKQGKINAKKNIVVKGLD